MPVLLSNAIDDVTCSAPQLGKTTTGQLWLLSVAWEHGRDRRPWWWTAPTYAQARHGFRGICDMARSAKILKTSTTTPPLRAELKCGAILEGRSWERPEGMYGPTVLGGVVDEFGQLTREAYSAISSRRAESITQGFGKFRYLGNVGDVGGPAEDLWEMAERGEPGFAARRWTWRDRAKEHACTCCTDPELLAAGFESPIELAYAHGHAPGCERGIYMQFVSREAMRMSSVQFRTLYNAEWADWNELPVYEFDRRKHVDEDLVLQPELELEIACDFNVDPMAWVIGQSKGEMAWALDEISIPGGATTEMACAEVMRRYPDRSLSVSVFGDSSGSARKTSATKTDYQIIRERLGGHYRNFDMRVPSRNPSVMDTVNAFNAMLNPAMGSHRYRVSPDCRGLIEDLARVSYRPGTRDIDKSDKRRTHFTDAERYRIGAMFPVRKRGGFSVVQGGLVDDYRPMPMGDAVTMAGF